MAFRRNRHILFRLSLEPPARLMRIASSSIHLRCRRGWIVPKPVSRLSLPSSHLTRFDADYVAIPSVPRLLSSSLTAFKAPSGSSEVANGDDRPSKKRKRENGDIRQRWAEDLIREADRFGRILADLLEFESE
jgi:hypothetical protein